MLLVYGMVVYLGGAPRDSLAPLEAGRHRFGYASGDLGGVPHEARVARSVAQRGCSLNHRLARVDQAVGHANIRAADCARQY